VGLISFGALAIALILGVALWFTRAIAKASLARRHPAPGRLVDVGGRFMHLNCAGQGHPTVILEAGLNDFSVIWTAVQRMVATFARVCSYDRVGLVGASLAARG
jgi:hypothetical protein